MLLPIALLLLPSIAQTLRAHPSLRAHLSDALKLKCDSLLYRSTYVDNQCYFAVLLEDGASTTSVRCSSILHGAMATSDAPAAILDAMMIDKTRGKHVICAYDSGYKCDAPEAMLSGGRCIVRAPKKMNFVDANNYCQDRGMKLPAPENDLDNQILRDVLVKDPVWVKKSIGKAAASASFKWSQAKQFSRWSTCDKSDYRDTRLQAAHTIAKLCLSPKDTATVLDKSGYWTYGNMEYLMDVVCTKNAGNAFTKEEISCNYHAGIESIEQQEALPACKMAGAFGDTKPTSTCLSTTGSSSTCYTSSRQPTRFDVFGKATVETRRGCEALCDTKPKCVGFSYRESFSASSCVLLSTAAVPEVCGTPTEIFLKNTNCVARTNLTAEFGDDPCIDSFIPITQALGQKRICPNGAAAAPPLYIIRAIDANGRRITLSNDIYATWLERSGNMWVFRCEFMGLHSSFPIIAAVCALAEAEKCPCRTPIKHLADRQIFTQQMINNVPTYPAVPAVMNPCQANAWLHWDYPTTPTWVGAGTIGITSYNYLIPIEKAIITCKAGSWFMWTKGCNSFVITALACQKV